MRDQSSVATQKDAEDFLDACQWAYECWVTCVNFLENLPEYLRQKCAFQNWFYIIRTLYRVTHNDHGEGR